MKKVLQWHPAFQAVLQIEFSGEAQYLQFFKEYNLTDSPLRIDTLVIKKDQGGTNPEKNRPHIPQI